MNKAKCIRCGNESEGFGIKEVRHKGDFKWVEIMTIENGLCQRCRLSLTKFIDLWWEAK